MIVMWRGQGACTEGSLKKNSKQFLKEKYRETKGPTQKK